VSAKDKPVSMPSTDAYRDGWDRLWGKPPPTWCGKPAIERLASAGCGDRTCPECYFVGHPDLLLRKTL
jgi:hypothetical protein